MSQTRKVIGQTTHWLIHQPLCVWICCVKPISTKLKHHQWLKYGRLRKRDYSRSLASEPDVKVSLHPAQASQRPCEGPVSSKTTCWLHDMRQTSMPLRGR